MQISTNAPAPLFGGKRTEKVKGLLKDGVSGVGNSTKAIAKELVHESRHSGSPQERVQRVLQAVMDENPRMAKAMLALQQLTRNNIFEEMLQDLLGGKDARDVSQMSEAEQLKALIGTGNAELVAFLQAETKAEAKPHYRKLLRQFHPDVYREDPERGTRIAENITVLYDRKD